MPSRKDYSPDKYGNFRVFKDMIKKGHNKQLEHLNVKVKLKSEEDPLINLFKKTGHIDITLQDTKMIHPTLPIFYDTEDLGFKTFHKDDHKKSVKLTQKELKAIYDSTLEALKKSM